MSDEERIKLILTTAKDLGLRPKLLDEYGLIAIEIDGQERYIYFDVSNPNTQLATKLATNKHSSRIVFARNGLPNIPHSVPKTIAEAKKFLAKYGPIIAKPLRGSHSRDIRLIKKVDELKNIDLSETILEKYIEGREFRYLVLSGKILAVHHKDYPGAVNDPELVRRISFHRDEWDKKLSAMAVKAAKAFGLKFAAVDFMVTKDEKAFILEINSSPGLERFQIPTDGPPIDFAKIFLKEIIKNYQSI